MQLGKGCQLYTVDNVEYVSHDDGERQTVYCFTITADDGTAYTAEAEYPGTPKRQYYRYPRLRDTMELVILTDPEKYVPSGIYIMRIHGTFVNFLDLAPAIQEDIIKRLERSENA